MLFVQIHSFMPVHEVACISLPFSQSQFVFCPIPLYEQYYLSGLLTTTGCDYWVLILVCSVIAERVFDVFDATRTGLLVSLATATLGPLIEVCARLVIVFASAHGSKHGRRPSNGQRKFV